MNKELVQYGELLAQIKDRIRQAQVKAAFSVNARMIQLYWDIGKIITEEQKKAGWGSSVIPKLSQDIRNELPEVKGFSERNIGRMISFYRAYPEIDSFLPQAVAKIETQSSADSASSNKKEKVPQAVALLPKQTLKDRYIFDFLTLESLTFA